MNDTDALKVLSLLTAAWPNYEPPDNATELWISILADVHPEDGKAAALDVVRGEKWFPSIARFLEAAQVHKRARQVREAEHRGLPDTTAEPVGPPKALVDATRQLIAQRGLKRHDHHGPDPCPVCGALPPSNTQRLETS